MQQVIDGQISNQSLHSNLKSFCQKT